MPALKEYDLFPADVPMATLPKLCLSKLLAGDAAESKALFDCCTTQGILLLDFQQANKGQQLLRDAADVFNLTERLFALDDAEKMEYLLNWEDVNGYKPLGGTKVDSAGTPDSCEFWTFSHNEFNGLTPPRSQPKLIEAQKSLLQSFMDHSKTVLLHLLSHLEPYLDLHPGTLSDLHDPSKPSGSQLRLLRYPPQPPSPSNHKDDHLRHTSPSLVPHTDQGSLTLLFNVLGGLQILCDPSLDTGPGNPQAETDWVYVRPEPGTAIVNCGDALRKWTGNVIKSPKHRVVTAPEKQAEKVRISVAYFARPEGEAVMARLGGSRVIPELGEEEEVEERFLAREWHQRMSVKYRSGNKGGVGGREEGEGEDGAGTVGLRSHGVA